MEFGMEKCAMLVMKSGKRHMTDRMELPSQDKIKTLGKKENFGHFGGWNHQISGNDSRNLIKGINNWTVTLLNIRDPFLTWCREKIKQMDWRTRKLMIMSKAWHPRHDVDKKKRVRKRTCQHWRLCWRIDTTTRGQHRKTRRRTD